MQKVQHRRKHQRGISKRAARQDVRQSGFDSLLARRAVIAVQDVFGDNGLEIFRDVFAAAGSLIAGPLEWSVTISAAIKDVLQRAVQFGQRLTRASGVTGLSARSFLPCRFFGLAGGFAKAGIAADGVLRPMSRDALAIHCWIASSVRIKHSGSPLTKPHASASVS